MRHLPGPLLAFLAISTFVGGCVGGGCVGAANTRADRGPTIYAPLPHHVPPSPEATSFRFAMVHDVVHERYARHGPAFYQERERLARERLAVLHRDSEAAFALIDDIAVGLDRRGRTTEAVALMRDKLKRLQALDLKGKDLYSSYANLAEFLIHGNLRGMLDGDLAARGRVEEGRDFLRKSIEVNPNAHFGREKWQVVAVDTLLAAATRPAFARNVDLVGNRLDVPIEVPKEQPRKAPQAETEGVFGRPYHGEFPWMLRLHGPDYAAGIPDPERRAQIRGHIFQVGGERAPSTPNDVPRGKRAAFDEPAMWLIGEWRQGSGPSPHFALCLGEIMLRVGQRYLAWTCYERAARMADRFWPTPELQQFLRDHCQKRHAAIERSLPAGEVAGLRPKFESELAFGEAYQRDYQVFEEEKVQAGADLNDPRFFDEFHNTRAPIASKVGPEEWYAGLTGSAHTAAQFRAFWEWGLLAGGAAVLLLALVFRWLCRLRYRLGSEITFRP